MNGIRVGPAVEGRERRYRMLHVEPELMLNVLLPQTREVEARGMSIPGLPDGVQIDGVVWSDLARAFLFRLWHPTFDVVPLGEEAPPFLNVYVRHEKRGER